MRFMICIIMIALLVGCGGNNEDGASIQQIEKNDKDPQKKVVLVMIDSMMGSLVDNSMEKGNIPALEFLINNGQYYKDLVTPFPSMSVVIESTLITGEMPHQHGIPGLVWYKQDENRIVDYGSTLEKVAKLGTKQTLIDSLYHLNNTHLSEQSTTIFEELQNRNYTTGSVNFLLYRGNTTHRMTLPTVLDQWMEVHGSLQTKGPDLLAFGSAVKPKVIKDKKLPDSIFSAFGLNDEFSVEVVSELIKQGEQPDFLTVFLPNFDKEAHRKSPHYRVGFEKAEHLFQDILNSYPSWEQALEENVFIIIGDHGQDKLIDNEDEMAIDLDRIYADYPITPLTESLTDGQLAFANNHRMSYVYPFGFEEYIPELAETAVIDSRIALASWKDGNWIHVISPDYQDDFRFKPGDEWTDRYDQSWEWEGNEDIVTLQMDQDNQEIKYVDYPDVLNQLYSAHTSHEPASIILAAKPGHTFKSEGAPLHVDGGEHGGVHKNDTLAAIVIAGTDKTLEDIRMKDLKQYIIDIMEGN
ncbi:alkaline phosphatase family protein [Bacillus alkalicellulosilyticus]|uniref:alkaline phosphatase family protein n=1 Tax=Alkalihalobacterium alkalicellulosilyticum TaxID=1912214 RepID=UPI00099641E5|nr:alkaline phosphatase family protein [Bacillus alkalicellulosilyticus]